MGLLTNKFDYLAVPLTIGYQTKRGNYFISSGPFVSLLVNNENRYAESLNGFSFVAGAKNYVMTRDIAQQDKFKSSDGGITLALGKYFSLYRTIKFSVEARSNFGFVDINSKSNLLTLYSAKEVIKTFSPCLLIGFSYKFEAKPKA